MSLPIYPEKLKKGDGVRVVTPSRSLAMPWMTEELKSVAQVRFKELGLDLSFAEHVYEIDDFDSSSIQSRRDDLHAAFRDPQIKLVITVIGGFNSNQLLRYLDYDLIRNNPKILCGYSDITALANAIHAKTGLVTYSGPHFFTFGDKQNFDYSLEYFKKCLMSDAPFEIEPSPRWSNDRWANDQERRTYTENEGYWVINEGSANGTIIGGNLCTLNLLQGTEYMPEIAGSILFLEDDAESHKAAIDRDLQSLIHQPGFDQVRGIVIGRFQPDTGMTRALLEQVIRTKPELARLPIIANVDFGHTLPLVTFPIGGEAELTVKSGGSSLRITKH